MKSEAAEALNRQIREVASHLPGGKDPSHTYGFSCECGCEQIVPLTVVEFDRLGGAWMDGHKPQEPAQRHAS